jgi:DNA-binding SARP family transcriptional activator
MDGVPVAGSVAQRRRIALLALLATAPPGGISRERLAAFLFPEYESTRAHRALSDALHGVRKALGRDAVRAAGDSLSLDTATVGSDVREFADRLAAGELEAAVSTYRGPFLDGFFVPGAPELERWIDSERARLATRFAEAVEALATAAERQHDANAAVGWWRRLAAHDPYSSHVVMRLADALVAVNDPAGALRQLQDHLSRLSEDLGIDADHDVRELMERLQEHSVDAVAPDRSSVGSDGPGQPRSRLAHATPLAVDHSPRERPRRRWWIGVVAFFVVVLALAVWRRGATVAVGAAKTAPIDATARSLYLRGRDAWSERTREGLDQAVTYFRAATERQPDYAEAYAGLADAYVILGYLGFRPAAAMFQKGKAAALRAIALDSTLADAYAPLGLALMWEHDWEGAERALRRAITLAPSYATAHQWYGILFCALGRMPEAVEHTRRASELDPLSRQIANTYGMFLYYGGDSAAALRQYRAVVDAEPDSAWVRQNPWLLSNASRVYTAHGLYDEALRALQFALAAAPRHPRLLWDLSATYVAMGQPERALATFAAADTASGQYAYFRASVFAVLGQRDSAFYWLDRVQEWGPSPVAELRMHPALAPIRSDPRYDALLRRLRLID